MRESIVILEVDGGVRSRFGVKVQPGARRPGLLGTWNGRLRMALASPPADGRANDELVAALADLLGLRRAAVAIVRGSTSRQKEVEVDLAAAAVRARLASALAGTEER